MTWYGFMGVGGVYVCTLLDGSALAVIVVVVVVSRRIETLLDVRTCVYCPLSK